jgi:hypothetical protein
MPKSKKQTSQSRGPFGLSIPEAGAMIGLGRNSSYEAAKRGEIPTLEFGALKIVPRIPWLKQIGVEDAASNDLGVPAVLRQGRPKLTARTSHDRRLQKLTGGGLEADNADRDNSQTAGECEDPDGLGH